MEQTYFIVSVTHTLRRDPYITFWRPKDSGYCWPLSWAGRYGHRAVSEGRGYYNDGDLNIAVKCDVVDALAVPPEPGRVDGDAGPVVPNNAASWKAILRALIAEPAAKPKPQFYRSRQAA
jgi:hypothetical protein